MELLIQTLKYFDNNINGTIPMLNNTSAIDIQKLNLCLMFNV